MLTQYVDMFMKKTLDQQHFEETKENKKASVFIGDKLLLVRKPSVPLSIIMITHGLLH
jgi:hypothetical protein